jgi:ABC-type multidrug transport system ATPase subunit
MNLASEAASEEQLLVVPPTTGDVAVSVRGLWKFYKNFKALEEVNLDIAKGEVFVLIGPNGSGKSTLLRILAGLIPWNKGIVEILGHSMLPGSNHKQSMRRVLGMMFDHSANWEKLTGYENAWYFARALGLDANQARNRVEEFLKWTDLWPRRHDAVGQYSYGMKRKLVLLEVLLNDPAVLLLDEPTIGLDYASRAAFFKLIKEMTEKGKTIIVSTNDVMEASQIADHIALINRGAIAATGTPADLIQSLEMLTRIEIKLARVMDLSVLEQIDGVEHCMVDEDYKEGLRVWLLAKSGGDILPQVVEQIVQAGSSILSLEVQQPSLRDVFLHYTGASL